MRKMNVLATALSMASSLFAADPVPVAYPQGYRQWVDVKSMTIDQGHALYDAFGGIQGGPDRRAARQAEKQELRRIWFWL